MALFSSSLFLKKNWQIEWQIGWQIIRIYEKVPSVKRLFLKPLGGLCHICHFFSPNYFFTNHTSMSLSVMLMNAMNIRLIIFAF